MEPKTKRRKLAADQGSDQGEPKMKGKKTIVLLPAEQLLREFLLECAREFPGLEIWITGGWVRDRLLGIPSSDLDLALSNLTGRQLGRFIEGFSAQPETQSKYRQRAADLGIPDFRSAKFHIVERNNNMSKKLETAGGELFGLDIDLVNLRKEVYDGQTRTPDMEFGTAEEDAFRRDATVNSMFFHLERQEVVDLTGRGLEDLDARIMRTPLDPRQTFMDDPLRVLRLIRVGSKLGFGLDPEAVRCMREEEIQRALDTMITRDRVNIELFKMMGGPQPEVAFQHLFEANLYTPVFLRLDSPLLGVLQGESGLPASPQWPGTWPRACRLLTHLLKNDSNLGKVVRSEESVHLWAMVAYAPLAGLRKTMRKQAVQEATSAIRATARVTKLLESALRNFDSIQNMVNTVASEAKLTSRSIVGMSLRSWGATWGAQVAYVILSQAVYAPETSSASAVSPDDVSSTAIEPQLETYSAFADFIWEQGLQDAHIRRPLLDGNEIQCLFGLKKGGKYIKSAIDALLEWQFDHDGGRDEAETWLVGQRGRLGVPDG